MHKSAAPQLTDVLDAMGAQPAAAVGGNALRAWPRPPAADAVQGPSPVRVMDVMLPGRGQAAHFYQPHKATSVVLVLRDGGLGAARAGQYHSACLRFALVSGLSVLAIDCGDAAGPALTAAIGGPSPFAQIHAYNWNRVVACSERGSVRLTFA